jgi:putative transposase
MPRTARLVVPGLPHHVTQRGNRRQTTFFRSFDFELYRQLLADSCRKEGVEVWAYCLLPNHVHLIAVPSGPQSLSRALGTAHAAYTRLINRREGWRGFLWQGRYFSTPMDEPYLLSASRYVLMNPVRAGLVDHAPDWPHSSLALHLGTRADDLVAAEGLGDRIADWGGFLSVAASWSECDRLRRFTARGAPLGDDRFLESLEARTGRTLRPKGGWWASSARCRARELENPESAIA